MRGALARAKRRVRFANIAPEQLEPIAAGALEPGDMILFDSRVLAIKSVTFLAHVETDAGKFTTGVDTRLTRVIPQ